MEQSETKQKPVQKPVAADKTPSTARVQPAGEIGGPSGAEPTRFGDWEVNGRCSDF